MTAAACAQLVRVLVVVTTAAASLLVGGCEALNPRPSVDVALPTQVLPAAVPSVSAAANGGAIFQAAQYRPLFEDHRARLVGDTLTVQIVEKVSASQKSTSSIDKSGKVSAGLSAVPFVPPGVLNRATVGGNSNNNYQGRGSTENTNDFSGVITATVTGVLPNGHLLVSGEKQIASTFKPLFGTISTELPVTSWRTVMLHAVVSMGVCPASGIRKRWTWMMLPEASASVSRRSMNRSRGMSDR